MLIEIYLLIVILLIIGKVSNRRLQTTEHTDMNHSLQHPAGSVHYAVWWKRVLLESLDYLKMGLVRHLIFCHDLAFSQRLC